MLGRRSVSWWQWCLLLLGIGAASWLIPMLIIGSAFGGALGSIRGSSK